MHTLLPAYKKLESLGMSLKHAHTHIPSFPIARSLVASVASHENLGEGQAYSPDRKATQAATMYMLWCQNGMYSTMETNVAMIPKIIKAAAACRLAFTVRVGRRRERGEGGREGEESGREGEESGREGEEGGREGRGWEKKVERRRERGEGRRGERVGRRRKRGEGEREGGEEEGEGRGWERRWGGGRRGERVG